MITKADTAAARSAPKRASQGSAGSTGSAGGPDRRTSSLADAGGVVRNKQEKKHWADQIPSYDMFMIWVLTTVIRFMLYVLYLGLRYSLTS